MGPEHAIAVAWAIPSADPSAPLAHLAVAAPGTAPHAFVGQAASAAAARLAAFDVATGFIRTLQSFCAIFLYSFCNSRRLPIGCPDIRNAGHPADHARLRHGPCLRPAGHSRKRMKGGMKTRILASLAVALLLAGCGRAPDESEVAASAQRYLLERCLASRAGAPGLSEDQFAAFCECQAEQGAQALGPEGRRIVADAEPWSARESGLVRDAGIACLKKVAGR
jgi:hypothetical protein